MKNKYDNFDPDEVSEDFDIEFSHLIANVPERFIDYFLKHSLDNYTKLDIILQLQKELNKILKKDLLDTAMALHLINKEKKRE